MKTIQSVNYKNGTKEELLPDFDPDFPYIASFTELDKFRFTLPTENLLISNETALLRKNFSGCIRQAAAPAAFSWIFQKKQII